MLAEIMEWEGLTKDSKHNIHRLGGYNHCYCMVDIDKGICVIYIYKVGSEDFNVTVNPFTKCCTKKKAW